MEIEREPKFATLSLRERLLTLLMLAFLSLALLSRFIQSPDRWRGADVTMSPGELSVTLGAPTWDATNEMRWYEPHLLGDWELVAERQGTQITSLRKTYHWPGTHRAPLLSSP